MSTPNPVPAAPNPALVAAAPILVTALTDVKEAITTILTGDPAQIALRAGPAVQILLAKITLLAPQLASAEEGVALQGATSGLDGLIAKLNGIATAAK
jgi:hypothetical protein